MASTSPEPNNVYSELIKDLTLLELYLILVAVVLWVEQALCFWCDNQAVVHIIN